jgi:hypothetical protein
MLEGMKRSLFIVFTLNATAWLTACSVTPPEPGFPEFGAVEVKTEAEYEGGMEARTAGKSAAKGAAAGVAGGAAYGALMGALACGPFFFACVPVAAAIGAASGGVVGAVGASMSAVSNEEAEALNGLMASLSAKQDFNQLLKDALKKEIPNANEVRESADATALVNVVSIFFVRNKQDLIQVQVDARLSVRWPDQEAGAQEWTAESAASGQGNKGQSLYYREFSEARPLDEWLGDDGQSLVQSVERALETMAFQMAGDLGQPVLRN